LIVGTGQKEEDRERPNVYWVPYQQYAVAKLRSDAESCVILEYVEMSTPERKKDLIISSGKYTGWGVFLKRHQKCTPQLVYFPDVPNIRRCIYSLCKDLSVAPTLSRFRVALLLVYQPPSTIGL